MSNTICAIATPMGEGGVSIIRLSGDNAFNIIKNVFVAKNPFNWNNVSGFTMHLGKIIYNSRLYDEVIVSIFRENQSYTGEDMVEINCHGGVYITRAILDLMISCGAELALPGEFTKRAFLNGRLDLSQAEGVIETIHSTSKSDLDFSLTRLSGRHKSAYIEIKDRLINLLAHVEVSIDFPEDELDDATNQRISEELESIINILSEEIRKSDVGMIYKNGIRTVLIGRTNVGKSSLLNILLAIDRAIVTDIPGTTRDTIEEMSVIDDVPLRLVDTAGIRDTIDPVEKIGVDKSKKAIQDADLVLFIIDGNSGFLDEDKKIYSELAGKKVITIVNKTDLPISEQTKADIDKFIPHNKVYISALKEDNISNIGKLIKEMFRLGQIEENSQRWIGNHRHKQAFIRSKQHLQEVLSAIENGMSLDFLSIDLKAAIESIGEISGETVTEEVIDKIFSDFCIGK